MDGCVVITVATVMLLQALWALRNSIYDCVCVVTIAAIAIL
jgi:hypothetical protein